MVKLTERLVLARSRASDLENVRKLNCWASDLTDISIIRKMTNVQIVSLSVNHITSLQDFAETMNLEELYIRKNDIANLAEIHFLRRLPRLRVLWLADNPCAVGDRYRMTVLKSLPNLQRLDNIPVQDEEVNEAIEQGLDLTPLVETLTSLKSSPDSSPAPTRRSRKFKEKKDSENSEEKERSKHKEVEEEPEKPKEKELELEDGGVERVEKEETKQDSEPDVEKDIEEDEDEKTDVTPPETPREETVDTETPSTGNSKTSEVESEDSEDKSTTQKEASTTTDEEEEESDEISIEEGEITLENPVEETNEIRAQFGLKPLPADKVAQPAQSRPSHSAKARNSNIVQAVLHLIKELDDESLQIVSDVIQTKLETL